MHATQLQPISQRATQIQGGPAAWLRTFALTLASLAVTACSSYSGKPMYSALLGTTGETITFDDYVIHQTGMLSLAANLGAVAPGDAFYINEDGGPETAVGLAWGQSFISSFQTEEPLAEVVAKLRSSLSELASLVTKGVRLTAAIAQQRALLRGRNVTDRGDIEKMIQSLEKERGANDWCLEQVSRQVEQASNAPGIIIARWTSARKVDASLALGALLGADASGNVLQDGFVVMGGIRVARFAFGDDARVMYEQMTEEEQGTLPYVSVVTYALQARHLAFTASEDYAADFRLALDLVEGDPLRRSIEKAQLSIYASYLQNLSTRGNLGPVRVSRKLVDMTTKNDLVEIGVEGAGWSTLHAQFTRGKQRFWGNPNLYRSTDAQ